MQRTRSSTVLRINPSDADQNAPRTPSTSRFASENSSKEKENTSSNTTGFTADKEVHPRVPQSLNKSLRRVMVCMYVRFAHSSTAQLQAAVAAVGLLLLLFFFGLQHVPVGMLGRGGHAQQEYQYAVYIDAGSSGTRIHVFRYIMSPWPAYVHLDLPAATHAAEPGLSHYAGQPAAAAESLQSLLDFAYHKVPEHLLSVTPVYLLATAGLRLLSKEDAAAILASCTSKLASSRFLFQARWARIISGDTEGLYAWAAANYATGMLEEASAHQHNSGKAAVQPSMFSGVLELGGASFQVTFMPEGRQHDVVAAAGGKASLKSGDKTIQLPGITRPIFTHSFLGLGMDAALRRAADIVYQEHERLESQRRAEAEASGDAARTSALPMLDPCLPTGYTSSDGRQGAADFAACLAVVRQVLPNRTCTAVAATSDGRSHSTRDAGSAGMPANSQHHQHHTLLTRLRGDEVTVDESEHDSSSRSIKQVMLGGSHGRTLASDDVAVTGGGGDKGGKAAKLGDAELQKVNNVMHGSRQQQKCMVSGVEIPTVTNTRFLAIENLFWTVRAVGLPPTATLAELREGGITHCSRSWVSLHSAFAGHVPDQFITRYCFGAAYVYALLHDVLALPLDERIFLFTNTVKRPLRRRGRAVSNASGSGGEQPGSGVVRLGGAKRGASGAGAGGRALSGTVGSAAPAASQIDGGKAEETVEVGLNWVVGAMLVEAMNSAQYGMRGWMMRTSHDGQEGSTGFVLALPLGIPPGALLLLPVVLAALIVAQLVKWRRGRRQQGSQGQDDGFPKDLNGDSIESAVLGSATDGQGWMPGPMSKPYRLSIEVHGGRAGLQPIIING